MTVCLSHGGPSVYPTSAPAGELLVATIDGIAFLQRRAPEAVWEPTRRAVAGKHVSALLHEPSQGLLFAGTHDSGLYRSADGGHTWQRADRGIASDNIFSVGAIGAGGRRRLYVGTEPAHLYVSADQGDTWEELPALRSVPSAEKWYFPAPPHIGHLMNVDIDPRDADVMYAAIEVGGLLKSTDGGRTWRQLSGFDDDVHRVAIPPWRPDHVYISTGVGLYHSPDGGETWTQLSDRSSRFAYPDPLILHPERADLLFTSGAISGPGSWYKTKTADPRIARSRDGGRTWELLEEGLPAHIRASIEAMCMNVWPGGFGLYAGTTDGEVFASDDEGAHWSCIANGVGAVSKCGHHENLALIGAAGATT